MLHIHPSPNTRQVQHAASSPPERAGTQGSGMSCPGEGQPLTLQQPLGTAQGAARGGNFAELFPCTSNTCSTARDSRALSRLHREEGCNPPLSGRVSTAASLKTWGKAQPQDGCINFVESGAGLWKRGKNSSLELSATALSKRGLCSRAARCFPALRHRFQQQVLSAPQGCSGPAKNAWVRGGAGPGASPSLVPWGFLGGS